MCKANLKSKMQKQDPMRFKQHAMNINNKEDFARHMQRNVKTSIEGFYLAHVTRNSKRAECGSNYHIRLDQPISCKHFGIFNQLISSTCKPHAIQKQQKKIPARRKPLAI